MRPCTSSPLPLPRVKLQMWSWSLLPWCNQEKSDSEQSEAFTFTNPSHNILNTYILTNIFITTWEEFQRLLGSANSSGSPPLSLSLSRLHHGPNFCRYHHLDDHPDEKDAGGDTTNAAKSSSDITLTALAQLGVLRLNAMRCIITLVGSKGEYVLAEASATLSLQDDNVHARGDYLIQGEGARKDRSQMGSVLINLLTKAEQGPVPHIVVDDLRMDERFQGIALVSEYSFTRSLACVPLRSERGIVIGALFNQSCYSMLLLTCYVLGFYCVLGDKPRAGLSTLELQFLKDISITTMQHIEAGRGKQRHDRAEKVLKALTLYLEGANSLQEWTSTQMSSIDSDQTRVPDAIPLDKPQIHFKARGAKNSAIPEEELVVSSRRASALPPGTPGTPMKHGLPTRDVLERLLEVDIRRNFSRASNLLREALDVDGVVFYDATITSFTTSSPAGSPTSPVETKASADKTEQSPTRTSIERSLSESTPPTTSGSVSKASDHPTIYSSSLRPSITLASNTDPSVDAHDINGTRLGSEATASSPVTSSRTKSELSKARVKPSGLKMPIATANILGYATRARSSLQDQLDSEYLGPFAGSFLRTLLKRYPNGKVFNIESSSTSKISKNDLQKRNDSTSTDSKTASGTTTQALAVQDEESMSILKITPGGRSVIWYPLWDYDINKWSAGALIWSLSPTRVFNPEDELTYMVIPIIP